jgi:Mce-associated membrane protein
MTTAAIKIDKAKIDKPDVDKTEVDKTERAETNRRPGAAIALLLRLRWPIVAIALTLALVGAGITLMIRTSDQQSGPANRALADRDGTTEVIGQVSSALAKVLSYQYANPSANTQAAAALLSGDAATQYKTLFTALQKKAPGEKLTLTAKVDVAAVKSLHGNTAELLVFLDQSTVRASDKAGTIAGAMLDITAVKHGATWKITELRPL